MEKFIIYRTADGTYGEQLRPTDNEEEVKQWITNNGGEILRPNAIVGKTEADAIARFTKASGLRDEAESIQKTGKREQDALLENERMQAKIKGGILTENEPTIGSYAMQLLKAPQTALVAGVESASKIFNPSELPSTLTEKFNSIYEDPNMAEEIATDPTLLIPTGGPIKAVSKLPKVGRYAVQPLRDAAIQTGASVGGDIAEGDDVTADDVKSRLAIGTVAGTAAKGLGDLARAGGKKILQTVIKPKTGTDVNQDMIGNLMEARLPSGEYVIKANSSIDKMYKDIEDGIESYVEAQSGSLSHKPNIKLLDNIKGRIALLREFLDMKTATREINEEAYEKYSNILDLEEARLMNVNPRTVGTPTPISEYQLHTAKKEFGNKSRYDIKNTATSDPTTRDAYSDLYEEIRGIITSSQRSNDPTLNKEAQVLMDKYKMDVIPYENDPLLKNMLVNKFMKDIYKLYADTPSSYDVASKAMQPLMDARVPVGKALEQSARNQSLTLPMMMGGMAGGSAGGVKGAVAGAVIPMLLNAPRAGTTLYRASDPLDKAGRYAIPTLEQYQE